MEDIEYERRWLVTDTTIVDGHHPTIIRQAYPFVAEGWCVRVRQSLAVGASRSETDEESTFTLAVKGPRVAAQRVELEWRLPEFVAVELYKRTPNKVVKSRFSVVILGRPWDIDFFHHDNEGLIIAECEFTPDDDEITPPSWCLEEVTSDHRYNNEVLAIRPFTRW